MKFSKRIVNYFFRDEVSELREIVHNATSDWQMIPYMTAGRQQALTEMLSEMDPQYMDFLIRMTRDYQIISSQTSLNVYRESVVKQSRALYLTDPLVQFAIELWTDYAFGTRPSLTAVDEQAQETWTAFFNSDNNAPLFSEREIHTLSEDELKDGELFFVFSVSSLDGEVICRTVPTEEIKEIVTDPQDSRAVLYYRRDFTSDNESQTLYYPDWHASPEQLSRAVLPPGAKKANEQKPVTFSEPGTDVVMLQGAFRKINNRGWPLASAGLEWENVHVGFMKDRAAVAKSAASITEKVKVTGGQRAIDLVRAGIGTSLSGTSDQYEKNPPPVAGSVWLENNALNREWMNRPTGASDAEKDGVPLLRMVGLAFKLYPIYVGAGESFRLATATAMEGPMLKSFNRYQAFWSSVWRDMFKIVCGFAEKYGKKTFTSLEVQVSSDRVVNLSTDDIGKAGTMLNDMNDRALIGGAIAQAAALTLLKTAMETIGVQGVNELFTQPAAAQEAGGKPGPFRGK